MLRIITEIPHWSLLALLCDEEKIVLLLKYGADVELAKEELKKRNDSKKMQKALEKQYKEVQNANSKFVFEAMMENIESMESILKEKPVDINAIIKLPNTNKTFGFGLLIWAISAKEIELVKLLLKQPNIDVNVKGTKGDTALIIAIEEGYTDIVKLLLDRPIDVNIQNEEGYTALIIAVNTVLRNSLMGISSSHKEIVKLLLKREDINVNISTKEEETALLVAASGGDIEIVEMLLKRGAFIDMKSQRIDLLWLFLTTDENFPIKYNPTLASKSLISKQIIDLLMEKGNIDINAPNDQGVTALMRAAYRGFKGVVNLFLDRGADINIRDNKGVTALMYAVMNGNKEMVEILLDRGANIHLHDNRRLTVLTYAVRDEHKEIIELFLNRYLPEEINLNDNGINSPLIGAIFKRNKEIIKLLLKYDADINGKILW